VVLLHGTGNSAGFMTPLLNEFDAVHAIAPDLPGIGLSDPAELAVRAYRQATVAWLDRLLDALGLDTVALGGHSGGGMWALWYALARPERVRRLVLIGTAGLPYTRCPLPIRMIATPGLGKLLSRLSPPSQKSVMRLARLVGEQDTLGRRPELADLLVLLVALGRDPITDRAAKTEFRASISPFGLLTPSGWRRSAQLRPDELRSLATPTLLVWGDRDPLGTPAVAQAIADLIPHVKLEILPAGHGPFLGHPGHVAATITDFVT
jgi:pimeloyl-ACP methyl ester carboxylesterase